MNADEPTPDLSETLGEIAEQAKPVDLSQAVARKVRSLRRRRNAAGGTAAVVAVVLVAGGGYALTRTTAAPRRPARSAGQPRPRQACCTRSASTSAPAPP